MNSRTKRTAGTDGEERALTPKLRFPEFQDTEAWPVTKLNKLLFEAKHRNRALELGPEDVLSVSGEHGCVNQIEFMGRSYAGATVKDYHVVEHGDIVYTKSPLKKNPYGIIKANKGKRGIVSTLYAVYRPNPGCSATFLDHFFSVDYNLNSYLQPIVRKGAKNDMKVNNADVLKGDICVPDLPEQQKIADCLDSVDTVVKAQKRKVEALKTHKKGLIHQLFPDEGETQPRLRLPEFQNDGDWSEKTVDTLAAIQSGATPSKANAEFWGGSIPWVSAKDMKRLFLEESEDHISEEAIDNGARLVPAGTLLVLTRGMTLLKDVPICILRREMSFNQDVKGLRPRSGVNGLFLAWMLVANKDRLLNMVNIAGHGTGKIDSEELRALTLRLPQPPEQKRIADCLTALEDLIAAESQKLDALKTHKKGLMQRLFRSVGEDNT
jgi:type I restriction enzyme S subunit